LLVLWPTDLALPFLSAGTRAKYGRVRVVWLGLMLGLSLVGVLEQPLWAVIAFPLLPCAVAALSGRAARVVDAGQQPGPAPTLTPATRRTAGKRGRRSRR
jgi:hypothetical protein